MKSINLRLGAAIAAGKAAGLASRVLRAGGGTTLPGVVARRIAPNILSYLSAALPGGVVVVGGTNGKTTTTRMIAAILAADGRRVLHNRAGANLVTGLTATALGGSTLAGRVRADLGLFETDEAALPRALEETQPQLVLLHNLFRDQLDRYGEVDTIASAWRAALEQLPASTTVLLNADDPAIAALGDGLPLQVVSFPIDLPRSGVYAGAASSATVRGYIEIRLPLPGLYNALNALAATAAGLLLGVQPARVRGTLESFSAAFGRIERVDAGGRPMLLALIKNPVSASETVRMLVGGWGMGDGGWENLPSPIPHPPSPALHLLVAINDKHADGTDVSWLWDADFEQLAGRVAGAIVSGTRAADMAVRLKYAGIAPDSITAEPDLARALDLALERLPAGATLYALPTYTAMLELRAELARRGWVRPFWED